MILVLRPTFGGAYAERQPQVWVHNTARVAPTVYLGGLCVIEAETEVRHCALIRGLALVGSGCVIDNSVELKNVIMSELAVLLTINPQG